MPQCHTPKSPQQLQTNRITYLFSPRQSVKSINIAATTSPSTTQGSLPKYYSRRQVNKAGGCRVGRRYRAEGQVEQPMDINAQLNEPLAEECKKREENVQHEDDTGIQTCYDKSQGKEGSKRSNIGLLGEGGFVYTGEHAARTMLASGITIEEMWTVILSSRGETLANMFQKPESYLPEWMIPCTNDDLEESPSIQRSLYHCIPLPDHDAQESTTDEGFLPLTPVLAPNPVEHGRMAGHEAWRCEAHDTTCHPQVIEQGFSTEMVTSDNGLTSHSIMRVELLMARRISI